MRHYTFNPWRTRNGTRVVAEESRWHEPIRWDRWAREGTCIDCHGRVTPSGPRGDACLNRCDTCNGTRNVGPYRPRVLCGSLVDVFEGPDTMPAEAVEAVEDARQRLLYTIAATPHLNWLLLTKRPQNVMPLLERQVNRDRWGDGAVSGCCVAGAWLDGTTPANLWLGAPVSNQAEADERITHLLKCPAAVRFLLVELRGGIRLDAWLHSVNGDLRPGWVIVTPSTANSVAESIVQQCGAAGVPVHAEGLGIVEFPKGGAK